MRNDVIIAILLIALFGGYYALAAALPSSLIDTMVTSSTLPKLLAATGIVLSVLLVVQTALTHRLNPGAETPSAAESPADGENGGGHARAFIIILIGAAYIFLLPYLGYLITLFLLFASVVYLRGGVWNWRVPAFAAAAALSFHIVFVGLLNVRMPAGILAPLLG